MAIRSAAATDHGCCRIAPERDPNRAISALQARGNETFPEREAQIMIRHESGVEGNFVGRTTSLPSSPLSYFLHCFPLIREEPFFWFFTDFREKRL